MIRRRRRPQISAITDDGRTVVHTDSPGKRIGFIDIADPGKPVGKGTLSLAQLGDTDDDPTSVIVVGAYALVVVDSSHSFTAPSIDSNTNARAAQSRPSQSDHSAHVFELGSLLPVTRSPESPVTSGSRSSHSR